MADVTANVLHNIGNVLNSVNISAGLATSTMRQSLIGDIGRIAALLREHAPALGDYLTSDPKGKQIPTYLVALGDHLTQEQTSVLIVDDNATYRRIITDTLEHWQMRPVAVSSSQKALAMLGEGRQAHALFKLVLLDAVMPGMDGFALAEQIKQHAELAKATIMMLTAGGHRGDAARCQELGIASYLTKPIKPSELLDAILTLSDASSQKNQPSAPVTRHSLCECRQRRRILLAEDNLVNQKLLVRLLENRGHTVVVATNGRETLAALERERFDMLLMDVQMPEMDGIQTTAASRHQERQSSRRLPIIAMTAHAMRGDREQCLQAGMDGYISKPVRADELLAVVEGILPATAWQEIGESIDMQAAAVFDRSAALLYVDGDGALLQAMAEAFLADYPPRLAEIQAAIAIGDGPALMRAAHSLKGGGQLRRQVDVRCGPPIGNDRAQWRLVAGARRVYDA
jgi:two-component system, sensor histidine kinase and response regulator